MAFFQASDEKELLSNSVAASSLYSLQATQNLFSHATLRDDHLDGFRHNTPPHTTSWRSPNTSAFVLLPSRQDFAGARSRSSSSGGVHVTWHTGGCQA